MRNTFLLLFILASGVFATPGSSQVAKVSINLKNATVAKVIDAIENQTDYLFVYSKNEIDLTREVSVDADQQAVAEVLTNLFDKTDIVYAMEGTNIMLMLKSSAQQTRRNISGKVTDSSGQPIPGASVVVKGTTIGVVTDVNGNFNLANVDPNATLIFSFIGMKTQNVIVTSKNVINVTMAEESISLDEVVAVGYGVQKRSDITGSVASVPAGRLEKLPVTNVLHAIEGSTAGINVTQSSRAPGSTASMQIRGINSINANTSPFIVLDGIPFFGQTNDINPNDIKSIELLKDASATAIYGTRGANGVILITTKRGTTSKPKITYNGYEGVQTLGHVLKPMSPDQYVKYYADFLSQNSFTQTGVLPNLSEIDNYNKGITTDWLKEVTQLGNIQEHTLSLSGGNEAFQYYISGSSLNEKGVVKGYQYKRTSFRTNIDAKITDYLKVGTSVFLTNNNYDGGHANYSAGLQMSPYSVPRDANGNNIIYPMSPEIFYVNPLLEMTRDALNRGLNITGNGYAEFTPGFIKGLKYRLNASYIMNINRTALYRGRAANDQSGSAGVSNSNTTNWVIENILSYNKNFGKNHFDFTGLYSAQKADYFRSGANSTVFINDALSYYNLGAGSSQSAFSEGNSYTLVSQMGRINYSYDSRYLLTLTARRDGYSAFGANTSKYGLFPSVAFAWNMANESFIKNIKQINQLKIRISHGLSGNQAIGVNQTQTSASTVQYPFGGKVLTGILFSNLGNADLNWETTTSSNISADFALFNSRVSGTIEAYQTKTKDILLRRNLPGITGYLSVWDNLGKMQNTGLEVTLKTVNINTGGFKWSTDLNFSTVKNEILDLYGDGKDDLGSRWFIGKPLRVVYDYQKTGIWQVGEDPSASDPTAKPGDIKLNDLNGDGKITSDDRVIVGQSLPKWIGGMTNTFEYKGFTLSVFLQTQQGGMKSNSALSGIELGRHNIYEDFGYWTPENKDNFWPALSAATRLKGYGFPQDWSYVRLKDVTLSYDVPKFVLDRYKISNLTVYLSGRDLHTFTKWFGTDPVYSYGDYLDAANYPTTRTISLGLILTL